MGQIVTVDEATIFESDVLGVTNMWDITADMVVEVSGYPTGDGTIFATRVEVERATHAGEEIEVKILSVDAESQRISLSLKQANPLPEPESKEDDGTPDGTRERAVPRRTTPLKGGVDRPSGGEDIGLKW